MAFPTFGQNITVVQSNVEGISTCVTNVCTFIFNTGIINPVTGGHGFVFSVFNGNGATSISSITDGFGSSYSVVQPKGLPAFAPWQLGGGYTCSLAGSGVLIITITFGSNVTSSFVSFAELLGQKTSSCGGPIDVTQVANTGTTPTPFSGGVVTTTLPNALIFASCQVDNGICGVGASFTSLVTGQRGFAEYKNVNVAGAYQGTFTDSINADDAVVLVIPIYSAIQGGGRGPKGKIQ